MITDHKTVIQHLVKWFCDAAISLVGWAVICVVLFGLRFTRVWRLVGSTWQGVLYAYLAFYFGSIMIALSFMPLGRIQSKNRRFFAQMIMCLILAVAACGVILVVTL